VKTKCTTQIINAEIMFVNMLVNSMASRCPQDSYVTGDISSGGLHVAYGKNDRSKASERGLHCLFKHVPLYREFLARMMSALARLLEIFPS
jgi:hypothetical protein